MTGTYPEYLLLQKGATPPADPHATGVRVYADSDGALRSIQSDGTDAAVGGGAAFNGGTITDELVVTPVHDSGSGTIEAYAKGDDYPARLFALGTFDNGDISRLVWAFEESGQATFGPIQSNGFQNGSKVDGFGGWQLRTFDAASAGHNILELYGPDGVRRFWLDGTGSSQQTMDVGATLVIVDHDSNPIFQIDEDGTIHIKTGTTIQADL